MKIRAVILSLAFLTVLTASVSGYLYYSALQDAAIAEAHRDADLAVRSLAGEIDAQLREARRTVQALAGLNEVVAVFGPRARGQVAGANRVLDHFERSLGVDVCFLIDRTGTTVASSNRERSDSFVGRNYGFRPYFQQAMAGEPGLYLALGVTSRRPGIYYSHPVYAAEASQPAGAAVIKAPIGHIEQMLRRKVEGTMLLADPAGFIFSSGRHAWTNRFLWKPSPEAEAEMARSQQFGKGPWEWIGFERIDVRRARGPGGKEYMLHEESLSVLSGWKIVFLHDLGGLNRTVSGSLIKTFGFVNIGFWTVVGVFVVLLYRTANREIGRRKAAEDSLSETNDRLQAIVRSSPLPIIIVGLDGKVSAWNPAATKVFRWQEQEVLGRPLPIVPERSQQEFRSILDRVISGDVVTSFETRRMRKDGALIDISVSTAPLNDAQGRIVAVMGILQDISGRKRAEAEISFLASIIQNIPNAVCSIDLAGNLTTWNRGAEQMLGYRSDEIIGRHISHIIPAEQVQQELEHCLNILNTEGYFTDYESVRLARDGRRVPVEMTAVAIRDPQGVITSYASIMTDMTERKRAEEERLKMRKLEATGILAGGIAHDFNNLLNVIVGYIVLAKMQSGLDEQTRQHLDEAERICLQAAEVSNRFITLAAGGEPVRRPVQLNDIVQQVMVSVERGRNITLELALRPDVLPVSADEGQVRQAVLNLVRNALEAMPQGGSLSISTENAEITAADHLPVPEGAYVLLQVRDSGIGITHEALPRIFDPYYTSKDEFSRKGLGLGLTVSHSIVTRHGGHIAVESRPGAGSVFRIYLPAAADERRF